MSSSTLLPSLSSTLTDETNNGTLHGLPMSTRITISVLAAVAAFGLSIITIVLVCHLLQSSKTKRKKKSREQRQRHSSLAGCSLANQTAPYHSNFRSSNGHPPGRVHVYDGHFREYDNWAYNARNEESGVYPDVISDLNRKKLAGSKEIRWTTTSLRAHDNYDYERYGRIPRAKLYERKEELVS